MPEYKITQRDGWTLQSWPCGHVEAFPDDWQPGILTSFITRGVRGGPWFLHPADRTNRRQKFRSFIAAVRAARANSH